MLRHDSTFVLRKLTRPPQKDLKSVISGQPIFAGDLVAFHHPQGGVVVGVADEQLSKDPKPGEIDVCWGDSRLHLKGDMNSLFVLRRFFKDDSMVYRVGELIGRHFGTMDEMIEELKSITGRKVSK